jgi:hypothetical protein
MNSFANSIKQRLMEEEALRNEVEVYQSVGQPMGKISKVLLAEFWFFLSAIYASET